MKIRLQGTKAQIDEMLALLKVQLNQRILSVSKPYKDRTGDTFRLYLDIAD